MAPTDPEIPEMRGETIAATTSAIFVGTLSAQDGAKTISLGDGFGGKISARPT